MTKFEMPLTYVPQKQTEETEKKRTVVKITLLSCVIPFLTIKFLVYKRRVLGKSYFEIPVCQKLKTLKTRDANCDGFQKS